MIAVFKLRNSTRGRTVTSSLCVTLTLTIVAFGSFACIFRLAQADERPLLATPKRIPSVTTTGNNNVSRLPLTAPPAPKTRRLPDVNGQRFDLEADEEVDAPKTKRLPQVELPPVPAPIQLARSVLGSMLRFNQTQQLELQQVIHTTLANAPEIKILFADVGIARAEVDRQLAGFDWTSFINTAWDDRNTPVASTLDGAQDRNLNTAQNNGFGVRQQNRLGGSTEVGQDVNFADSNSQFFNPTDQATARLGLTYEQPLLQGGGRVVATSRYEIAVASSMATSEETIRGLQSHVSQTINAYWELVASRARLAIQKTNHDRAAETFNLVENRGNLDVGPAQTARSEATLAARKTELLRNEYAVLLAQEQLLRLMLGASFDNQTQFELIPTTDMLAPTPTAEPSIHQQIAIQNRPEIKRSLLEIKQSSIELGVAENLLLPVLGLTLSMSNQGLRGNREFFSAFSDQLDLENASYGVGLAYEIPFGNRAAKANLLQAKLRLHRLQSQFEAVIADVTLEVRNAAHNLTLAIQELELSTGEMILARRELSIIEARYKLLIDGDNVGALYLDNLLQTQERLAGAESRFVTAAVRCKQAEFELQRANGLLLRQGDTQSIDSIIEPEQISVVP